MSLNSVGHPNEGEIILWVADAYEMEFPLGMNSETRVTTIIEGRRYARNWFRFNFALTQLRLDYGAVGFGGDFA